MPARSRKDRPRRGAAGFAASAIACAALLALWTIVPDTDLPTSGVPSESGPDAVRVLQPASTLPPATFMNAETVSRDVRDVLAPLRAALVDPDANVRMDAVSDLGDSRESAAEALLSVVAVQDPEPKVRAEALFALGVLHAESRIATFQLAINDPDRDVRSAAIGALEDLGGAAAGKILSLALNDPDPSIREAAAAALGVPEEEDRF